MSTTLSPHELSAEQLRATLADRLRLASDQSVTVPLSFAQERLWFLDQLEPNSPLYNIPTVARLAGPLDVAALGAAIDATVARHEALRTRIVCVGEDPVQVIDQEAKIGLNVLDLSQQPEAEVRTQQIIREEVNRPFDLARDRLLRVALVRLAPQEHLLIVVMHHIVSDEWSLKIFFNEVKAGYQAASRGGGGATLQELPIQYGDFALWQRKALEGEIYERQLQFWKGQMEGLDTITALATDHPRRPVPAFRGATRIRVLSRDLSEGLLGLARQQEATLFMVLLAAFKTLLYRYTGQDDLVVGSPIAGRNREETEGLIGFFVNTLALRTRIVGTESFVDLLRGVRERTLSAFTHQDLPFEKLVEELQPERSLSHLPFTRIMFAVQNGVLETLELGDVTAHFVDVPSDTSKFDLTFAVQQTERGLVARVEYDRDLFEPETLDRLLQHFETLLEGIVAQPNQRLAELPLLSKSEREQLLVQWNQTATDYPRNQAIHTVFEAQAKTRPDAIAVVFGDEALTYRELNQRANQLAHYLKTYGVRSGVPVAVCMEGSCQLVVALLGALKAGGCYLPLDPKYPKERLAFMLHDASSPVLLTQQRLVSALPRNGAEVICLDTDWERIGREPRESLAREGSPDDLAYVMYTSGSTGQPKGVAVPHRAVNRLVQNTDFIRLGPDDRVAQVSNVSFDAATFEIWGALLNGGQLLGISQEVALSPNDFARELKEKKITAMFLTAAIFNQVAGEVPGAFEGMRTLIVGGEALDPKWVRAVLKNRPPTRLVNGYGPTENTTFSCCYEIGGLSEEATQVPIGRPIANSQAYVLDANLQPVPIGVPGELFVGGDGLARGYWRRPELTAERFVPNPFTKGEYLYRTGDLARFLADGNIEFLGRRDEQVKVRGFRIELGEIEAVLAQHPAVREAVVVLDSHGGAEKRLLAYFVPKGKRAPNVSGLISFLKQKLPEYMVPAVFVPLTGLPLTPNGKVDRRALPSPEKARPELERKYAAPRDEVEVELALIWEKILDLRPIGIEDKFFDLGGHSLLATRVISQIEKRFGKRLRLATIFQAQTIEELAAIIREEIKEGSLTAGTSLVEIQSKGSKPPLFLVHGAGGGMFWGYVNLSRHLGREQPVYGFKSRGLDGLDEFETLEQMAAQYIKDLRVVQPRGPYHLGGYCFGGNVAFEMARQLSAAGDEVALLALVNCAPPNSAYTRIPWTPRWGFRFLKNLCYWGNQFRRWTPSQRREFLDWKVSMLSRKVTELAGVAGKGISLEAEQSVDLSSFSTEQQKLWDAHIRAQHRYQPRPFPGKVHLFRSAGHPVWSSFDPNYGWAEFAGGVTVTVVPATHEKILEEPFVEVVGTELKRLLAAAESEKAPRVLRSDVASPDDLHPTPENGEAFWKTRLASAPDLIELPTDFPRPATQSGRAGRHVLSLAPDSGNRLRRERNSAGQGDDILLASLAVLLNRYSRQDDIIIAIDDPDPANPVHSLGHQEQGFVIRVNSKPDCTGLELMSNIEAEARASLAHGKISFSKLAAEICPKSDPSYHPIFQILFHTSSGTQRVSPALSSEHHLGSLDGPKVDLAFGATASDQKVELHIEYAADLFKPDTAARMLRHWERLIQAFQETPGERVSRLPMLTAPELRQLEAWNQTSRDYPRERTLINLFAEQVASRPEAVALVDGNTRWTYKQLDRRVSEIAAALRDQGVGRQTLAGICLTRSAQMVAAILAVLRAGGAYVPMDPVYPRQRLAFMMEDAHLKVLLTERKLAGLLEQTSAPVLCIEDIMAGVPEVTGEGRWDRAEPADLAYVIYTSGSTGKPKGVALEHRNAVAFVSWAKGVFPQDELDGVLASTSVCFDLSIFEMFVPLCCGGKVILAENALALPTLPAADEVVLVNTVPSAIRELVRLKGVPRSVRVINLAGEPLPTPLVDQIYDGTSVEKVYDLYGPTETTTYSTFTLRKAGEPATIGRPLANEQVYLLDPSGNLQPVGVPGELYIGGDGVAREYLNRPELTAERFVRDPFQAGSRLYRTGDLARWRADGNIEFLGRIDHQVKVRGFRIELGEIETALKKHPAVEDAVVVVREDKPGDRRLVGYVAARKERAPAPDDLRRALKEKLPEYMLPGAFVFLEALPLTPNGKIDRKALPIPGPEQRSADNELILPRNQIETQLAGIWREVLHLREVGVLDNFFDLGGHSLLAIQVVSRIREHFKIELPLSGLFDAPTIAALSESLSSGRWSPLEAEEVPLVRVPRERTMPASFVQERLWFLDKLAPRDHAYNVPMAVRLFGKLDSGVLQAAFQNVIERHEILRTTFDFKQGNLVQLIAEQPGSRMALTDLSHSDEREKRVQDLINAEARAPFDLAKGPLLRARLVKLAEEEHALVIIMHHTISDGWSQSVLLRELRASYDAGLAGTGWLPVDQEALQYADFAAWQRRQLDTSRFRRELAFWEAKLSGAPSTMELPVDHPRDGSGVGPRRAGRLGLILPTSHAKAERLTPFMVLVASLGWTLRQWTDQKDMVIGTVTAGRNRREIENVMGCFMNFLPLRLKVNDQETIGQFLEQARSTVLQAQAHQECPFERIVAAVKPDRTKDQNPLYNVALLLQNFPAAAFAGQGVRAEMMPVTLEAALLDLRFEALEQPGGILLECEFQTDLFEPGTVELLLGAIAEVFKMLSARPEAGLNEVRVSPALVAHGQAVRRRTKQTIAVAATFTGEPVAESLEYWFQEFGWPAKVEFAPFNQVFQQLLDPASLLGGNQRGSNVVLVRLEDWLTVREGGGLADSDPADLDQPVDDLLRAARAFALRSTAPCLICFCPPSSAAAANAALSGAIARAEKRLESENIPGIYVITTDELRRLYPVTQCHDPKADELGKVPYTPEMFTALGTVIARKLHALSRPPFKVIVLDCDQTLWSGVCGEDGAKGIRLEPERRALQDFMRSQRDSGMLLCLCSKNNEADVHEVFHQRLEMPLRREHLAGWRLNWLPKSENLKSLAQELRLGLDSFIFVDDSPVECAEVEANCPEVLTLRLPEELGQIQHFLEQCWAFDHLKVTQEDRQRAESYRQNLDRERLRETSTGLADFLAGLDLKVEIKPMEPDELSRVAQLTQRTNQFNCTTRRRTDGEMALVQTEVLVISVTDRFGDYGLVGVVIFESRAKTLDVETFLLSCRVLGRGVEHRVLCRLGEIARERGLDYVDIHFVPSEKNRPAEDFLQNVGAAFSQPLNGGYIFRFPAGLAAEITYQPESVPPEPAANAGIGGGGSAPRARAARKPAVYKDIARIGGTAGEIQRAIEAKATLRSRGGAGYVAPRTDLERQLCDLWQKLLRVEKVGINDNFFELGGHSLLAIRLFAEQESITGRKLPLVTLFQAPTVGQIGKLLSEGKKSSRRFLVPIQPNGTKPPLFLIHGAGGDVLWGYANLATHMQPDQPIYGIKSRGQAGLEEFDRLEEMAACYLQEIRSFQREGPYVFGGYCFGGNVAYEMARQLRAQGEDAPLVVLFDTSPANVGYESAAWGNPRYAFRFVRNLYWWLKDFGALTPEVRRKFVIRKIRSLSRSVGRRLLKPRQGRNVDLEAVIDPTHFRAEELKLWQGHLQALVDHVQQPYDGPVTLLRTRGQALFCSLEDDFCWRRLVNGVEVHLVPGSHESIFVEPHVRELAHELTRCLDRAFDTRNLKSPSNGTSTLFKARA